MGKPPLLFPSPYGDYGSYLSSHGIYRYRTKGRFRPLTGIMVLIGAAVP